MKKKLVYIISTILIILTVFTGCKIEKPDDVAQDKGYSTKIESTLSKDKQKKIIGKVEVKENKEENKEQNKNKTDNKNSKENIEKDNKQSTHKNYLKNNSVNSKMESKNNKSASKTKNICKNQKRKRTTRKTKAQLIAEANKHRETGKKDKYLTDPTPEGMPKPVEWQNTKVNKSKVRHCILSVDCLTILQNMKKFNKSKINVLPKNGIIYKSRRVKFYEGESVFDMLNREMKKNRIHMEFSMTPIYNSNYIEGIHNLYEFDCGNLSGWMYKVNGWYPNYGCSRYVLKDGDVVNWRYTCDLGRDVGCTWMGKTKND